MFLLYFDELFEAFELFFKACLIDLFEKLFDLREEVALSRDIFGSAFRVNDL